MTVMSGASHRSEIHRPRNQASNYLFNRLKFSNDCIHLKFCCFRPQHHNFALRVFNHAKHSICSSSSSFEPLDSIKRKGVGIAPTFLITSSWVSAKVLTLFLERSVSLILSIVLGSLISPKTAS